MAKLKAPLLSLGAAGAIGKAIVYFPWKGLNVAREYVIPSNPKSPAQTTQRGYFKNAVIAIHAVQALGANGFLALDYAAYSLWGSIFPGPRTWFNQIVKDWVDQNRATLKGAIIHKMVVTPAATTLGLACTFYKEGANSITAGNFKYGLSKTALILTQAATVTDSAISATLAGLVTKTKYYFQFVPTAHADFVGVQSGIYAAYTS